MIGELKLKSPLTKEDWDKIADVELEKTNRVWFKTPSGKSVEFIPVSVIDDIKAEIKEEKECAYADFESYKVDYLGQDWEDVLDSLPADEYRYGMERALEIISKHTSGGAE